MSFVITGTGRSGSGWISRVLSALGIRCGHESVFNPRTIADDSWRALLSKRGCDSSWCAGAVLGSLPAGTTIIHLVRNPVAVIRSMMGIGFLSTDSRTSSPYAQLAAHIVDLPDDPLDACVAFWIDVTGRIHPALTVTVESDPGESLARIVVAIGHDIPRRRIESAVRGIPIDFNSRHRDTSITWRSLSDDHRERLAIAACRFGYSERDLETA